jgi:hypothetical protein
VPIVGARREARFDPACGQSPGVAVLDVIYVVVTIAVFAIVALVAKGAERL